MQLPCSLIRVCVLVLAAFVVLPVCAQEMHWTVDPAHALYKRSAFAHGYIHGYEMGYHTGDFDFQMSRSPRELKKLKEFKSAKSYYSPQFGNRDKFVNGYEDGFRVGYLDAYQGKEFRAAKTSRALAEALQPENGGARPDGNFDQGFSKGYKLGLDTGLEHGRENVEYAPQSDACDAKPEIKQDPKNPYCKAFGLGYELGYSDGYNNQRTPDSTLRTAVGEK